MGNKNCSSGDLLKFLPADILNPMKVIRARVLGYCMGVKRAVEAAESLISNKNDESPAKYTLGPLIHNPSVLESLRERGMAVLKPADIPQIQRGSEVVIRAHGTTPRILEELEQKGATIIDATCPKVHLSQKRVREWSRKGYSVIIAGDRNHGEVTSISGYCDFSEKGGNVTVVQNREEALCTNVPEKSILIAQTTFSPVEFEEIRKILTLKNPEIRVFSSICSATMERQNALSELQGRIDGVLVIGGKDSANTRRLFESAQARFAKAALIETAKDIPEDFYALEKIGLTAGASTPDSVIEQVEKTLLQNSTK